MVRSVSMEPERTFLGMRNPLAHYIPLWILVAFVFFVVVVCTMGGYQDGLGKRQFPETKVNGDLEVTGSTSFGGRLATGPGQIGLDLSSLLDVPAAGTNDGTFAGFDFSKLAVTAKNFQYILEGTRRGSDAGSSSLGSFDMFIRTAWGNTDQTYRREPLEFDAQNSVTPAAFTNRRQGLNFYGCGGGFRAANGANSVVVLPEPVDGQVLILVLGSTQDPNTAVFTDSGIAAGDAATTITIQTGDTRATAPAFDDRSVFLRTDSTLGATADSVPIGKTDAAADSLVITRPANDPALALSGYIICRPAGPTYQIIFVTATATGTGNVAFAQLPA